MGADDSIARIALSCTFVRGRNALAVRACFGPLFMDYYLHLMAHGLRNAPDHDALLKDALVAIALHMASRPRDEVAAWTINLQDPALNLFVTCNSRTGGIAGRVFTESVKEASENLFHSQVVRGAEPARQSAVPFAGRDLFAAAEAFYRRSQQLPARYFRAADPEDFTLVVAQPDCDLAWLEGLDDAAVAALEKTEDTKLLETRQLHFGCDCSPERIRRALTSSAELAELLDQPQTIECPRCGAKYRMPPFDRKITDERL